MMRLVLHLCFGMALISVGMWLFGVVTGLGIHLDTAHQLWAGDEFFNDSLDVGIGVCIIAVVVALLVFIGSCVIFGLLALMVMVPLAILVMLLMGGMAIGWPLIVLVGMVWLLWPSAKTTFITS